MCQTKREQTKISPKNEKKKKESKAHGQTIKTKYPKHISASAVLFPPDQNQMEKKIEFFLVPKNADLSSAHCNFLHSSVDEQKKCLTY